MQGFVLDLLGISESRPLRSDPPHSDGVSHSAGNEHRQAQIDLPVQSQAKLFRLKALECLEQADVAKYPETQETFKKLAVNYENLAIHAESIERPAQEIKLSGQAAPTSSGSWASQF